MQQPDFQTLSAAISFLPESERSEIKRAFDFAVAAHAPQKREDGSPYVFHVIEVAILVATWKADRDTIIAALLHDVIEDTPVKKEEIIEKFGRRVALLVESITKLTVSDLSADLPLDRKIETLRKLFDVMRYDMRSVLIKLADRLHNVQTISSLPTPERRKRFALETLDIYHRIALHLGMRDVRHVYAEQCVPYAYEDGAEAQKDRNRFFEEAKTLSSGIKHDLKHTNGTTQALSIEIQPRNLLTFYLRRQAKRGEVLPIDAFLISIQVETEDDCYGMLRLLHTLYRPVSGQFRDYIAAPSDAGYQSLHTIVTLPDGRAVEVRIRTPQMEKQARRGITLWLFEGQKIPPNFSWLKRSEQLDMKTRDSSAAFWEALEADILSETISVSIDRRRLSVPKGSTLLDAAYAAYDAKAGFLLSATIGGKTESFATALQEDDDIYLTFDQKMQADFGWLQMVATQHARMLIVEVLKKSDRSERLSLGASLLQKELDHYGKGLLSDLGKNQLQQASDHFRRRSFEDVLLMIGEGVIRARDVVFFLFPEHVADPSSNQPIGRYPFRLRLTATERPGQDALSLLQGIIRTVGVTIERTNVKRGADASMVDIVLSGSAADRFGFADFLEMLERQEWTSRVQTLIARRQQLLLIGSFLMAFLVVLLDVTLFPQYQIAFQQMSAAPQLLLQALPIIPILGVNYYLLRLLRHYLVRMRGDRWFVGLGFALNIIGIVLIVWKTPYIHIFPGIPFVVLIFAFGMLFLAYKHAQAFIQLEPIPTQRSRPLTKAEKDAMRRRKILGYVLRFGAVFIWGIEPVLIRYTPIQQLSPLLRVNIWAIAGAVSGFLTIFLYNLCLQSRERRLSFTTPYNRLFIAIVLANLSYNYFLHKSLLFTTATKVNLMLSYAPVFALLVAFLIWRNRIPYLRSARSVQQMLLAFGLSSIGGTLLIYGDYHQNATAATGDIFALLIAISDVVFIMSNIYYVKYAGLKTNTIALATHHFLWIAIATFCLIEVNDALFATQITYDLTQHQWLANIAVGVLTLLGLVMTFEAFKRIDGLLAFLMLNLAPFVAFIAELTFFDKNPPTLMFLVGGLLIVGASVLAELINARCEKPV